MEAHLCLSSLTIFEFQRLWLVRVREVHNQQPRFSSFCELRFLSFYKYDQIKSISDLKRRTQKDEKRMKSYSRFQLDVNLCIDEIATQKYYLT